MTQVQSLGQEDLLEKGMATHSSILAWRIPWTEEPGGLQPMGSQGVGHELKRLTLYFSLQPGPILGCVCLLEALLAPERTEGSLCLAFTAALLYQHDPPAARAGDGPGD